MCRSVAAGYLRASVAMDYCWKSEQLNWMYSYCVCIVVVMA